MILSWCCDAAGDVWGVEGWWLTGVLVLDLSAHAASFRHLELQRTCPTKEIDVLTQASASLHAGTIICCLIVVPGHCSDDRSSWRLPLMLAALQELLRVQQYFGL